MDGYELLTQLLLGDLKSLAIARAITIAIASAIAMTIAILLRFIKITHLAVSPLVKVLHVQSREPVRFLVSFLHAAVHTITQFHSKLFNTEVRYEHLLVINDTDTVGSTIR